MKFTTVEEIQSYLVSFRKPGLGQKKPGFTFERVQYLARLAGDPQNQINVIHIAGTSGKGSTSTIISQLLARHHKKVGLSISPHLYDFRERAQINNTLIPEDRFCAYFSEFYPVIEQMEESRFGMASFYEIMIVFPYYVFLKEQVDYAVMETGAGGRTDATNVATREDKVAVITKIGLDHMDILGKTIGAIAGEKAAIIHPGNIAVSVKQRPAAQKVIKKRAEEMQSQLSIIEPEKNYKRIKSHGNMLRFDFSYKDLVLPKLDLSLQGVYQVENASVALGGVYEVAHRDGWKLQEETIRDVFSHLKTPGRFEEIVIEGKRIIIDGAHNPQKMSAFIRSLKKRHPGDKFDFLIGFKKGKDYGNMLKYMVPLAKKMYVSTFVLDDQSYEVTAEKTETVARLLEEKLHFTQVEQIEHSHEAFNIARKANDDILVITGSLYLIGELYKKIHGMIVNTDVQRT